MRQWCQFWATSCRQAADDPQSGLNKLSKTSLMKMGLEKQSLVTYSLVVGYILTLSGHAVAANCDDFYFMGSSYCFISQPENFAVAMSVCHGLSGSLVKVDTTAEFNYIAEKLAEVTGEEPENDHWVGLRDEYVSGVYLWADGDHVTWKIFWDAENGEPDESKTAYTCVVMKSDQGGRWAKAKCGHPRKYICEVRNRCDEGEYYHTGSCFAVSTGPLQNRSEAASFCEDQGYDELLKVANDSLEHDLLTDHVLQNMSTPVPSLWTGNEDCVAVNASSGDMAAVPCDTEAGFLCDRERRCLLVEDSFYAGGLCHRVIEVESDYGTASDYCESESGFADGHLAWVNSSLIQEALMVHLRKYHPNAKLLIGLRDSITEGSFLWDDGSGLGYSNWQDFQPDNYDGNQNCVILDVAEDGKWYDVDCALDFFYSVCQNGSAESDDSADTGGELVYFNLPLDDDTGTNLTTYPQLDLCWSSWQGVSPTFNDSIKDNALRFANPSDGVRCSEHPGHAPSCTGDFCPNDFTLSLWVNIPEATEAGCEDTLVSFRPSGKGFVLVYSPSRAEMDFHFVHYFSGSSYHSYKVKASVETGKWLHVVATGQGTTTTTGTYLQMQIYVNGVLSPDSPSVSSQLSTVPESPQFSIGIIRCSPSVLMDDVWYWNEHMSLRKALGLISSGVFYHWPMDDLQNTRLIAHPGVHSTAKNIDSLSHDAVSGNSVQLDGVSRSVDLGYFPAECLGNILLCDAGFTVSLWFVNGMPAADQFYLSSGGVVMGFSFAYLYGSYEVAVFDDVQKWRIHFRLQENVWSHIFFHWASQYGLKLFIDGVSVAWNREGFARANSYPAAAAVPSVNFYAGQLPYEGMETYGKGTLDELMFWEGIREDKLNEVIDQDVGLIGCFDLLLTDPPDSAATEDLDMSLLTPGKCRVACARSSKKYAGISDGSRCACGDSDPNEPYPSSACHYPCPGNGKSKCGGYRRQSIWQTTGFSGTSGTLDVWGVTFTAGDGPYIEVNETTPINITFESNVQVSLYVDFGHDSYIVEHNATSGMELYHSFPSNDTYLVTLLLDVAEVYLTYFYNVTVEEPVERITNIILSTEPTALGNETVIERVVTTGTHLRCAWDFGDGDTQETFTMYPDYYDELRHAYAQEGVYEIRINCTNRLYKFNTWTTAIVQVALTEIDLEPFSWDFGKDIVLTWMIASGTNLSFSLNFDGKPIADMGYSEENQRGWATVTVADYVYEGEHGLELNGTNLVSFVQHFIYVMIMDKVERPRVSHFKPYVAKNEEWQLTVEVDSGSPIYFVVDFGDYTPITWMITYEKKIVVTKTYDATDFYPVKVYIGNYVAWYYVYYPMAIHPYPCNFPLVRITGIGRDIHKPRVFTKSEQVVIQSLVTLDCAATIYAEFHWSVTRLEPGGYPGNFTLTPIDIAQSNFSEIVFRPGMFDVGAYNVSLKVGMVNISGIVTEQFIYMNITESPLIAEIEGGSGRRVAVTGPVTINALLSYDPDVESRAMSNLTYDWYCRRTSVGDSLYPCDLMSREVNTTCFGQNVDNVGVFEIPADQLDVNSSVVVAVNIRKGDRSKCFGQVVEFVDEEPPILSLECKSNCGCKVNPSSVYTLNASCEACIRIDWEQNMDFRWDLQIDRELVGEFVSVDNLESMISTGITTSGISFKADKLEKAVRYRLRLYATLEGRTGFIEKEFVTNTPPFDGRCDVQPKVGFVMETPFEFACYDWVDEGIYRIKKPRLQDGEEPPTNAGLMYEFRTRHPMSQSSDVFYYGPDSFTVPSRLPMGNPTLYVDIRIYDTLGDFAETTLEVEIRKRPDPLGIRTEELYNITHGEECELKKLLGVGNTGAVSQIVAAVSSEMNVEEEVLPLCSSLNSSSDFETATDAPGNETLCSNVTAVEKVVRQMEIRSALIETMVNVTEKIQTPSAAQQSASALREATGKTAELTKESTSLAIGAIKTATRQLSLIRSTSDQDIATSKDLVQGLGNTIKAGAEKYSAYKDSIREDEDETSEFMESEYWPEVDPLADAESQDVSTATNEALAVAHHIAMVVITERLVGQEEVILESDTIGLQVMRGNPRGIANKSFETTSGNFTLPGIDSLPQSDEGYLNVEVIEMRENYLSWDASSSDVKSPVIGLSFTDPSNKPIVVSNTTSWYEITFNTDFADFEEVEAAYIPDENDEHGLSFQSIVVDTANNSVSLIITPPDPLIMYNAFVKYDVFPSVENYDLSTTIPHHLNLSDRESADLDAAMVDELQYTFFLPSDYVTQAGTYILGLQQLVLNATSESTTPATTPVTDHQRGGAAPSNETGSTPQQFTTAATTTAATTAAPTTADDSLQANTTDRSDGSNRPVPDPAAATNSSNFTITIFSYGCRYWDEDNQVWTTDGCKVSELSNTKFSRCLCNHLTSFGSDFFVPPNTINFKQLSLADLDDNLSVLVTVLVLILIYFLLLLWGRRADRTDFIRWGVFPLVDNREDDDYFYQITVKTGVRRGAGTKSKIHFQVYGDDNDTGVRSLHDGQRELFLRSSVDRLLMAVPRPLGDLLYLNIWHDNSGVGDNRAWFLNQLEITDVQTNEKFYFLCDHWFAVDEEDGKVDRLLPVAGRDNLLNFSHLFFASTRKNLSDNHLWFSVLSRPTRSGFNRVQRVSCCFALLFLTMITSAMFYQDSAEEAERRLGGQGLRLGPIRLSYKEVYVGVASILIVSPVSLTVIQLFRKCEAPPGNQSLLHGWRHLRGWARKRKYSKGSEVLVEASTDEIGRKRKKRDKQTRLAWYWVYLAWALVFLSIVVPSIFLVMYSMQWKKEKSERWLTSMVVAICNSLLVVEPMKVIMIAFLMSLIFKKPAEEEEDEDKKAAREEIKEIDAALEGLVLPKREEDSDTEMEEEKSMEEVRKVREQELQMNRVIQEILGYFFFLFLLTAISNNNSDGNKYYFHKSLVDLFVSSSFNKIQKTEMVHDWMNGTLLPGMYPQLTLHGKPLKMAERHFIGSMNAYRIGPPRLRQARVVPDGCEVADEMQKTVRICNVAYSYSQEDDRNFGVGWSNTSVLMSNESILVTGGNPWAYRTALDLAGMPISGHHATYSGGGYEAILGTDLGEAQRVVDYLLANSWINKFTHAVFVEFTLYNAQVNLFASVTLILEYPSTGSITPGVQISVFRLYDFIGGISHIIFMMAAHTVYALSLMYNCIMICYVLRSSGKGYFKAFWNVIDFSQTAIGISLVVMYIIRYIVTVYYTGTLEASNRSEFVNFQYIASLNELYSLFIALVVFFAWIKALQLLRFNKRIGMLAATIRYASETLIPFSVLFGLILSDFAAFGYLWFGRTLVNFRSFVDAFETLLQTFIGKFYLQNLSESLIGPVYFVLFSIICFFILLNMLISIVVDAFTQVRQDVSLQSNDYEIVDFMKARFKQRVKKTAKLVVKKLKLQRFLSMFQEKKKEVEADNCDVLVQKMDEVLLRVSELVEKKDTCKNTVKNPMRVAEADTEI